MASVVSFLMQNACAGIRYRLRRELFGESPEMVRDFMELRGVGIVDIKAIFGIGSIVRRSRIDLVIHLEFWQG